MKLLVMTLILLSGTSCSNKKLKDLVNRRQVSVIQNPVDNRTPEATIQKFIAEWEAMHPERTPVTTPVFITDLEEEDVLGYCITWLDNDDREIQIDREAFSEFIKIPLQTEARTTVHHELGHCELGRDHENDFARIGQFQVPWSIMYSSLWPQVRVYRDYTTHYKSELFGGPGELRRDPQSLSEFKGSVLIYQDGRVGVAVQ